MEIYSDNLAKLFASENISVEIKNTSTAYFDVKNRRMTFPSWIIDLPIASRELLMLHEASHALHTPEFGTHEAAKEYENVFRTILNVLEDKRIEDAMKEKYPGAKSTFIRGFYELVNQNFFGINFLDDVNSFSLIDRMNLYFKGDYYFDCFFDEEEQYWVERAANNKTFDEVYQNAIELYEWLKDKYASDILESINSELQFSFGSDNGENDGGVSIDLEQLSEIMDSESFQNLMDMIDEKNDEAAKEIIKKFLKDDNLDFSEHNAAKTDNNWEKQQENIFESKFQNDKGFDEALNCSLPRLIKPKDFIISNKDITEILKYNISLLGSNVKTPYAEFIKHHKDTMKPIIAHMVREFHRKKAAEDYRRTKESKTGNLDLKKLSHYKYNSDLFLNKSVVKDEKNHGFVLLIDWSGSMNKIMTNAVLQLITNVMFCKSIDVPFVAYAFTSNAAESEDYENKYVIHATEKNDLRLGYGFKLLELFDSSKKYEEQLENLYYLAFCYSRGFHIRSESFYKSYILPHLSENGEAEFENNAYKKQLYKNMVILNDLFDLSSTPLNESLILMNYILPMQKERMNVDVMNLIVITDGDSDELQSAALNNEVRITNDKLHRPQIVEKFTNNSSTSIIKRQAIFLKSMYTNKIYKYQPAKNENSFHSYSFYGRAKTRFLAKVLKEETGANVISIEISGWNSNRYVYSSLNQMFDLNQENDFDVFMKSYRKNGFAVLNNNGYDQIIYVNSNIVGDNFFAQDGDSESSNEGFDNLHENEKGGYTTKQLTTALNKNISQKSKRKFLASRIVDFISEKQKVSA